MEKLHLISRIQNLRGNVLPWQKDALLAEKPLTDVFSKGYIRRHSDAIEASLRELFANDRQTLRTRVVPRLLKVINSFNSGLKENATLKMMEQINENPNSWANVAEDFEHLCRSKQPSVSRYDYNYVYDRGYESDVAVRFDGEFKLTVLFAKTSGEVSFFKLALPEDMSFDIDGRDGKSDITESMRNAVRAQRDDITAEGLQTALNKMYDAVKARQNEVDKLWKAPKDYKPLKDVELSAFEDLRELSSILKKSTNKSKIGLAMDELVSYLDFMTGDGSMALTAAAIYFFRAPDNLKTEENTEKAVKAIAYAHKNGYDIGDSELDSVTYGVRNLARRIGGAVLERFGNKYPDACRVLSDLRSKDYQTGGD